MNRYTEKIEIFIMMGKLLVSLSTCKRLQVATIIFPTDCSSVYAIGYNGPSRGLPNDSCSNVKGKCGCVHAEINAIAKFNNDIAKPSLLYCTHTPCRPCASLILNCATIKGVIWSGEYRDSEGIDLIRSTDMPTVAERGLNFADEQLEYWKAL